MGEHGEPKSGTRARGGRELRDAVRRELSRCLQEPAQPHRRPPGARGCRRQAAVRVELDRERGLPEVSATDPGEPPGDGGVVAENSTGRRARLRSPSPRRGSPSRHASCRDVHRVQDRTKHEQGRRSAGHVLVGSRAGTLASVRAAPYLGRSSVLSASSGHSSGRAELPIARRRLPGEDAPGKNRTCARASASLAMTTFSTCRLRRRVRLNPNTRKCPRPESNQRTRFRKPLLYPLSYGGAPEG